MAGRLFHDIDDGTVVLQLQRHEEARHEWKIERHVKFIAVTEVFDQVLRPLVRFGEENGPGIVPVDDGSDLPYERMGLGKVFA